MIARWLLLVGLAWGAVWSQPARAQGLIWRLPEDDRAWVRYEGTYQQLVRRPNSTEGDLTLQWRRNLEIKSVGREEAEHDLNHDGQPTKEMCRWIEIKVVTGKVVEGLIDAGPGGTRIYKILVPESAVQGRLEDADGIFVEYVPIVKGFKKLGDEPAAPIESHVFQDYPVASLIRHLRNLRAEGGEQGLDVPAAGNVNATVYKGDLQMETVTTRTTNSVEMWVSSALPFGLAKWTAKAASEQKNPTEARATFREIVELKEELTAIEAGTGAESELVTE
jgi:hypothetical protein